MSIRNTVLPLALAAIASLTTVSFAQPKPTNRVEITVTRKGFNPDKIAVKKGQPMTLAFTRKTDATCAKTVVIDLGEGKKIQKDLPLDKTVEVTATFPKTGELSYSCGMDMVRGILTVE